MRTVDLIKRKRDGEELSPDEIEFLVDGYTRGEIPDYQMSSFLMAVFYSRLVLIPPRAFGWSMAIGRLHPLGFCGTAIA